MTFTKEQVWEQCIYFGVHLWLPRAVDNRTRLIDGAKLLYALSGCESSFGENCVPRHEPYWHNLAATHTNVQLDTLTALFQCDAHSSFGPWQLLLLNATGVAKPEQFADIHFCAMQTAAFINHRIFKLEKAQTVAEIAAAYNAGRWKHYFDGTNHLEAGINAGVEKYVETCQNYYDREPVPGATHAAA